MSREKQISAKQGFKWWATQESIPAWWWSIMEVPRKQPRVKVFLKQKNDQWLHNSSSNIHVQRKNKHYQSNGLDWWWPNIIMKSIVDEPRGSHTWKFLLKQKTNIWKEKLRQNNHLHRYSIAEQNSRSFHAWSSEGASVEKTEEGPKLQNYYSLSSNQQWNHWKGHLPYRMFLWEMVVAQSQNEELQTVEEVWSQGCQNAEIRMVE